MLKRTLFLPIIRPLISFNRSAPPPVAIVTSVDNRIAPVATRSFASFANGVFNVDINLFEGLVASLRDAADDLETSVNGFHRAHDHK